MLTLPTPVFRDPLTVEDIRGQLLRGRSVIDLLEEDLVGTYSAETQCLCVGGTVFALVLLAGVAYGGWVGVVTGLLLGLLVGALGGAIAEGVIESQMQPRIRRKLHADERAVRAARIAAAARHIVRVGQEAEAALGMREPGLISPLSVGAR